MLVDNNELRYKLKLYYWSGTVSNLINNSKSEIVVNNSKPDDLSNNICMNVGLFKN